MFIKVKPHIYCAFYDRLLKKFVKEEVGDSIVEYPSPDSRLVWTHIDKENNGYRSVFLFKPNGVKDFSHEYFWRRHKTVLKTNEPIAIYAEAYAKALKYIGISHANVEKYPGWMRPALMLQDSFIQTLEPELESKEILDSLIDDALGISELSPHVEVQSIAPNHDFEASKDSGTLFIENQLAKIVSKMPESDKWVNGIVFMDIDNLTQINNKFGREVGDTVLQEIAGIVQRRSGFKYSGRCGDDTFYGVLFKTTAEKTMDMCHKLKSDVSYYSWRSIADRLRVTCTIGTAVMKKGEDPYSWFERAIIGMVEGKAQGQNIIHQGPQFLSKRQIKKQTEDALAAAQQAEEDRKKSFSLRKFFS